MDESKYTPGPWHAFNMVGEDGQSMTPEQLGEYVKNSVKKSIEDGGSADRFLFITTEEGAPDICHVGNGPRGPHNARLIAAAPELLEALTKMLNDNSYYFPVGNPWGDRARAVIAKAEGR